MNFIPEQPKKSVDVPFFDDVTSDTGWQGQSTTKSIDTLKMEIVNAVNRLGGQVSAFQRGKFQIGRQYREGFQLHYYIETENGAIIPGRIDIAALPVREHHRVRNSLEKRQAQSLKMSLYMLREALNGTWFLQQLSPGYAPLMPWMLTDGDKTLTQLWQESPAMKNLLPPGETEFVEGNYREQQAG